MGNAYHVPAAAHYCIAKKGNYNLAVLLSETQDLFFPDRWWELRGFSWSIWRSWRTTAGLCWAQSTQERVTPTEAPQTLWTLRSKGTNNWNTVQILHAMSLGVKVQLLAHWSSHWCWSKAMFLFSGMRKAKLLASMVMYGVYIQSCRHWWRVNFFLTLKLV